MSAVEATLQKVEVTVANDERLAAQPASRDADSRLSPANALLAA